MLKLAEYALRSPLQTALLMAATLLMYMGLVILLPLLWISIASIALVAMRKGFKATLLPMFYALLMIFLLSYLLIPGAATAMVVIAIGIWLPSLVVSLVLRHTVSISMALQANVYLALAALVVIEGSFSKDIIETMLMQQEALSTLASSLTAEQMNLYIQMLPGVITVAFLFNSFVSVLLARWWQSRLFNAGGFKAEYLALRLDQRFAWLSVILVGATFFAEKSAAGILIVLISVYAFQGVAIAHNIVSQRSLHVSWLVVFYVLLLFIPQTIIFVAMVAFVDTWADFRSLSKQPSSHE
mgnify:CR=1 FL=1